MQRNSSKMSAGAGGAVAQVADPCNYDQDIKKIEDELTAWEKRVEKREQDLAYVGLKMQELIASIGALGIEERLSNEQQKKDDKEKMLKLEQEENELQDKAQSLIQIRDDYVRKQKEFRKKRLDDEMELQVKKAELQVMIRKKAHTIISELDLCKKDIIECKSTLQVVKQLQSIQYQEFPKLDRSSRPAGAGGNFRPLRQ